MICERCIRLIVEPFLRLDPTGRRTRLDPSEVRWSLSARTWDLRIGTRQLSWGVAESRNVVDVVNQRDLGVRRARDLKLGQPMLEFAIRSEQVPGMVKSCLG